MSDHSKRPKPDLALVPIRNGSKGLAGKNLRAFGGRPLYEHAVQQGLDCASRCLISTDIEAVISSGGLPGSEVLRRPAELATDHAPMDEVIGDAIRQSGLMTGTMVLLQATTPLRRAEDIEAAIALYSARDHDLVLSVTATSPAPLKYGFVSDRTFVPVSEPRYCFANRQTLPPLFRPNGAVYVFGIQWFLRNGGLATDRIGAIEMGASSSLDIDTLEDFEHAEKLYVSLNKSDTARPQDSRPS